MTTRNSTRVDVILLALAAGLGAVLTATPAWAPPVQEDCRTPDIAIMLIPVFQCADAKESKKICSKLRKQCRKAVTTSVKCLVAEATAFSSLEKAECTAFPGPDPKQCKAALKATLKSDKAGFAGSKKTYFDICDADAATCEATCHL